MTPSFTLPCFLGLGAVFVPQVVGSTSSEISPNDVDLVASTEEAPLVVRIHSLHGAVPKISSSHYQELLLPALAPSWTYYFDEEEQLFETPTLDDVVSLIYELNEEEFDYEGRTLNMLSDGRLLVVASEETQDRIEGLLQFLAGAFTQSAHLVVDVVTLSGEGSQGIPLGLVDGAAADAWLAGLAGRASHRQHRVPIRASEATILDQSREFGIVWDYDVEIAERAVAYDPVISMLSAGLRLGVEATPAPGGTRLALCLRDTEIMGSPMTAELNQSGTLHTDNGMSYRKGPRALEIASLVNHSSAWSAYIPEGSALVQESFVGVKSGSSRRVLVLRVEGQFAQPLSHFDSGTKIGKISLLNMGAVLPPRCVLEDNFLSGALPHDFHWGFERSSVDGLEENNSVAPYLSQAEFDYVSDFANSLSPDDVEQYTWGPWMIGKPTELYDEDTDGSNRSGIHPSVFQLAPAVDPIHFQVALSRTGPREEVLARGNLATLAGTDAVWVFGVESSFLADIDVEVAQGSSVGDPVVMSTLDGLALQLRPRRDANGDLTVAIDVFAHVLDEVLDAQPLQSSVHPDVARKRATHLLQRTELNVDDSNGTWSTVLGDSKSDAKGGLALKIAVR